MKDNKTLLIDNIEIQKVYIQPELDMSLKPLITSEWENYLLKRYKELDKCVSEYHKYYLILIKIRNIIKSGKGITDNKVKYLFGGKWDD